VLVDVVAAFRSALTFVAVSLYVLVTAPIGMLLATLFGWTRVLYIFGHGGVRLGLALSGIRYRVAGAEHLPLDRGFVACSNHMSYLDPVTFAHFLYDSGHPPYFLGKEEVFRVPFVGWVLRSADQIPVHRESGDVAAAFAGLGGHVNLTGLGTCP